MVLKDWLIGTLSPDGYLKTESGKILLTTLPKGASQPPEAATLPVAEEYLSKTALVRGCLVGNVLYSAQAVETLPRLSGALIQKLAEKGVVSLTQIQEQLSELESEDQETAPPKKLCALVIGHKKSSPGAVNERAGLSEFHFNEDLAIRIEKKVQKTQIQRVYRRTWEELPADINVLKPHFVLSLHCNAYNSRASGTEVLYYHSSDAGRTIAEILQRCLVDFLSLPDRGIKPKTSEDRGGYLLRYTNAPCVIAEPFFIDNDHDFARAQKDLDGLAAAYTNAIDEISQIV
ncbi:MAG: N-acetylmuramoyl-L-alanine amidase [Deltaproteobacteria bacterium]|jgi:N-acetylmuramoyl-L-alanine amidase|nr:N-acetylmuramoyl-L-alanine amidase [Deltaproteobacteria bacterium]MDL2123393.1 N-acetylmuramoyl-L-alanine amidase [Deltaproteobacteria bacterium]